MVDIHEQFNSRQKTRIPVLPIKAANFFQLVQKLWHIRNYKRKSTGEKGNKQQNKAKQNLLQIYLLLLCWFFCAPLKVW